jgi:hypothetical protein
MKLIAAPKVIAQYVVIIGAFFMSTLNADSASASSCTLYILFVVDGATVAHSTLEFPGKSTATRIITPNVLERIYCDHPADSNAFELTCDGIVTTPKLKIDNFVRPHTEGKIMPCLKVTANRTPQFQFAWYKHDGSRGKVDGRIAAFMRSDAFNSTEPKPSATQTRKLRRKLSKMTAHAAPAQSTVLQASTHRIPEPRLTVPARTLATQAVIRPESNLNPLAATFELTRPDDTAALTPAEERALIKQLGLPECFDYE